MLKILSVLFFLFTSQILSVAQTTPIEGSILNYRIVGFSFPTMKPDNHIVEIALGNYNSEDSFQKNILSTTLCKNNKIILEVPSFGTHYTWRVVQKNKKKSTSTFHHFSTSYSPLIDTTINRLKILKPTSVYPNAYVFFDYARVLYDMKGNPVWYLPDIPGILDTKINIRDLKLSPQGTITFLTLKGAYEVNYEGTILWKAPDNGKVSGDSAEHYHHEFTRLSNGHYMIMGSKKSLWELPIGTDTSLVMTNTDGIIKKNNRLYQKIEFGTLIEYDQKGNIVWSWNSSDYYQTSDMHDRIAGNGMYEVRTHPNSFHFDEKKHIIYVSCRDNSRIIKLHYPDGKVINAYGSFYQKNNRELIHSFFCYQHTCRSSPNGYLYLYNNNGCNKNAYPSIIIMKEPQCAKDTLRKIWEYSIPVPIVPDSLIRNTFLSGGSVVELPDSSILTCMAGNYSKTFIVGRNKQIVWDALPEKKNPIRPEIWDPFPQYRASVVFSNIELEKLIWNNNRPTTK